MNKEDFTSVVWLLVLYTLQGVPMGMSAVFPLLVKERGASYADLAWFSMCSWPFALKLLWAPIVDGTSLPFVGRRKSWLVPCQLLIGALMYYLSTKEDMAGLDINELTLIFFALYFLAATQDIAVDGWALSMLSKDNVGYAGTCNSVGQTAGYFLAFSGFFGLAKLGVCSLESFMLFWSFVFIAVTVLVAVFKPEIDDRPVDDKKGEDKKGSEVLSIYREMGAVISLPSVRQLSLILLTGGIPFIDGLIGVKFQDAGVSSEIIALLATLTTPVHIALPWLVSRWFPKSSPLNSFRMIFPVRVMFQLVSVGLILLTPTAIATTHSGLLVIFYGTCLSLSMVESAVMQVMFVSKMTFFAQVSDPLIGGTYMTVLNTISNIGGNIAGQLSYRTAAFTTVPKIVDGFYVVVVLTTVYGLWWIKVFGPRLTALEKRTEADWRVNGGDKKGERVGSKVI